MKAVHFGAGNIGRGFIGKVLADADVSVTFADVDNDLIDQLAHDQSYSVKVVGEESKIEEVRHITAVNSASDDVIEKIVYTDLVTTAVGPNVLKAIAATIAKGLERRFTSGNLSPLNIIACENMVRGTSQLKKEVLNHLPSSFHEKLEAHVGFVDSAVDRIVPPTEAANDDSLEVTVESFSEWIVDELQFKGDIPNIEGMQTTQQLMAFVERKLFTLNTGHIVTAYLGSLKGHETIRDAISDPEIYQQVLGAMQESGEVLIQRYGFDREQHAAYILKVLGRFSNPYLRDEIVRVGRQPLRKLGKDDRLIKPLLGTLEYSTTNECLKKGIAAALCYRNSEDDQAIALQQVVDSEGVAAALQQFCDLAPESDVVKEIQSIYDTLR